MNKDSREAAMLIHEALQEANVLGDPFYNPWMYKGHEVTGPKTFREALMLHGLTVYAEKRGITGVEAMRIIREAKRMTRYITCARLGRLDARWGRPENPPEPQFPWVTQLKRVQAGH